ncbi:site-specific tyrosine recombinase/integron integrase [Lunatimonas salinarum]|uniref:site-specific tyrosine recombinase/integron integrase n=1 Tax=Lunatimonas salinarum TaxID=1774590 RepID=UPI001ADF3B74|nr:site-specific tyrosine recombinase/integron integrase [Lunatimonas salinarum]
MKKTIVLKNDSFGKNPVLRLEFPFDFDLKELVKTFPGASWYPKERVWAVPYSDTQVSSLLAHFRGSNVWLDYSLVKKVELPKVWPDLPPLADRIAVEIQRFRDWLRNRRYSEATVKNYCDSISVFFRFLENKDPEEVTNEDMELFNRDYILARGLSESYQSLFINGVKLYFAILEDRKLEPEIIRRPRRAKKLPHVLSKEEVKAVLEALTYPKHRLILLLLYSCGLRRGELINLRVTDIQLERGVLMVRKGKGKKDRLVRFPPMLRGILQSYIKASQPREYLIEGQKGGAYSEKSLAEVFKKALHLSGINKPATPHWLRHSYATHLHEGGTDIRFIQELLGHQSSRTTEIYTHVSTRKLREIRSPIEDMDLEI